MTLPEFKEPLMQYERSSEKVDCAITCSTFYVKNSSQMRLVVLLLAPPALGIVHDEQAHVTVRPAGVVAGCKGVHCVDFGESFHMSI